MMRLSAEPIYQSPLMAIMLALGLLAVVLLVAPRSDSLTPRQRRWLMGLRAGAWLLLVLAMLRPTLVRTDTRPAPATLAVLMDGSRSMTLSAGNRQDRWSVQRQVWQRLGPTLLSGDDQTLDVRVLAYAKATAPLPADAIDRWLDQPPTGPETDLAAALRGAISAAGGRPLAGVVLMGDGTQTAEITGPGAQQAARMLAALEVPLWTVPIGPRPDGQSGRDVEIDAVPESFRLFSGNAFTLSAVVRTQSLAGAEVPVRVRLYPDTEDAGQQPQGEELAIRSVVPQNASDSQELAIELTAPAEGRYRLEVVADEQPGEAVTTNNRQIAFLDVREGGGRILYLEGEPRQEQTFLRRALRRFPDLQLTFRWIRRDTADRWPVALGDGLQPGRFDIYVIGDLDASALGQQQLRQLADRVGEGAGLLMLGGLQTFGVGGYADSPLADVLPIRLDASLRRSVGADPPATSQLEGPLKLQVARPHPITRLDEGGDPQAAWDQLKPLLGASRFVGPKVAPGVQVLLQTQQQDPILVVGEYGSGRVAAFAGDTTWQWWRQGASEQHRRFWRQLMLWLLAREMSEDDQVVVELDARRFASTSPPAFRVHVPGAQQPDAPPRLAAEVIAEDGTVTPLTVAPQGSAADETVVGGILPQLPPGLYRLRGFSANPDDQLKPDALAFQVIDDDRELARPLADPALLEQLAALTAEAGGRAFAPDQVDELLSAIHDNRQQAVSPVVEKKRLGDGPLSGWLVFVAFAGLLIIEWTLRRRWGLA